MRTRHRPIFLYTDIMHILLPDIRHSSLAGGRLRPISAEKRSRKSGINVVESASSRPEAHNIVLANLDGKAPPIGRRRAVLVSVAVRTRLQQPNRRLSMQSFRAGCLPR